VVGSSDAWFETNTRDIQVGSFFNQDQARSNAKVVVLGPTAVTNLFGGNPNEALNKTVRINRQSFRVIGVMQTVGLPGDNDVVTPLNAARSYVFGHGDIVNQATVQATRVAAVPAVEDAINNILDNRHQITNPASRDFEVQSLGSRITSFSQILQILT